MLRQLTPEEVSRAFAAGAQVVDVRPVEAYAAAHIPGALSIPLRDVFATWLGWTADPTAPLIVVRDEDQDPDEVSWQALKIGYENLGGELAGGMITWSAAGLPVRAVELLTADALGGRALLDVRQRSEYTAGHIPGASNVELGLLTEAKAPAVADGTAVMCGHGERAMTAASLLERAGQRGLAVVVGGPADWAERTGQTLATGP
jgi:rhodanese-related sulfurtransferase